MPKPFLISRSSGWYVRFLVPVHARKTVGSRFIVRALGHLSGDEVRFAAARLGYALSRQFTALKASMTDDTASFRPPRKARLISGDRFIEDPWGFSHEVVNYSIEILPDGTRRIQVFGPQDHAMALEMLRHMDKTYQPTVMPAKSCRNGHRV